MHIRKKVGLWYPIGTAHFNKFDFVLPDQLISRLGTDSQSPAHFLNGQNVRVLFHNRTVNITEAHEERTSVTALFSNLLSNAVESAQKSEDKIIEFSTAKNDEAGFIVISIMNSCDTAPQTDAFGNFKTTKGNQRMHGYGLKSIDRVIKKYGGISMPYYDSAAKTFRYIIQFPSDAETASL